MSAPARMPPVFGDLALEILSRYFESDIIAVLTFDGALDEGRLRRAARLLFDAEPILAYRFVPHRLRPYWQRCEDLDDSARWFEVIPVEGSEAMEAETVRLCVATLDRHRDPGLRFTLLRGACHRLVVKINHTAADAGGLKEVLASLASTYRRLERDEAYVPPSRGDGDRSYRQVLEQLPAAGTQVRGLVDSIRVRWRWHFPMRYWSLPVQQGRPTFLFERIGPEEVARIEARRARLGATVNDLLLAAALRAFHDEIQPAPDTPLRIISTADLRRYLPEGRAAGLGNLSGFINLSVGTDLGATGDDTVALVKGKLDRLKGRRLIGLHDYVGLTPLLTMVLPFGWIRSLYRGYFATGVRAGAAPTGLTNMGRLDEERLCFGQDVDLTEAFLAPPMTPPPSFVFGVTGYRDTMTLSVGTEVPDGEEPAVARRVLEGVLRHMVG